jgi:hypothetical protein
MSDQQRPNQLTLSFAAQALLIVGSFVLSAGFLITLRVVLDKPGEAGRAVSALLAPLAAALLRLPTDQLGNRPTIEYTSPALFDVGLALLVPVSVWVFLRHRQNLPTVPPSLRLVLTFTRVAILGLLVWVLGNPVLKATYTEKQKPVVAVLFDQSQSMLLLPAGPFEPDDDLRRAAGAAGYRSEGSVDSDTRRALNRITRAKLSHAVAENGARPFLERLGKKYDVQYYAFAREPKALGGGPGKLPEPPPPGSPGAHATHIGDAIGKVLDESARRPGLSLPDLSARGGDRRRLEQQGGKGPLLAGVIVVTDGQNTGGRGLSEVGHAAARAGTPVFTIPVGPSRRPRDVAIVDLFATSLVSVGDTASVTVTLESSGFDGRTVPVELREGKELVARKDVVLRDAEQQVVELTFEAKKPGSRYLTVSVPPQAEEPDYLRGNNSDTAFVRISEEKLRVLYLEGVPRWDFRFLRNSMKRDNGLGGRTGKQVDVVLEAEWRRWPKEKQVKALPRTLEQLAEYHTIVIGDVAPRRMKAGKGGKVEEEGMLDRAFLKLLDKAVREKGVGLIVQAGPLHMPHEYDSKFLELLPVRLQPGVAGRQPSGTPSFRIELAPEGPINEAMRFYDDPLRTARAWANLPRYYWSAATERPAPGATVLAYNPVPTAYGKAPLIAHQYAGRGRVMFVGHDSTWLWRQNVGERFFGRFWGQAIRFAARRDPKEGKKSWIEARPVRAQPGEEAEVELMAFTGAGVPRTEPEQTLQVTGGGTNTRLKLQADPAVKGRYVGRFTPQEPGEYRLTYRGKGDKDTVEARLRVAVSAEELRRPMADREALRQLAVATGGVMVELPDLASIEDRIKGEASSWSYPYEETLWDGWRTLALLILLYTLDVGLRRLMGLS